MNSKVKIVEFNISTWWKEGDLSDLEHGIVVGARRAFWLFEKLMIY